VWGGGTPTSRLEAERKAAGGRVAASSGSKTEDTNNPRGVK